MHQEGIKLKNEKKKNLILPIFYFFRIAWLHAQNPKVLHRDIKVK